MHPTRLLPALALVALPIVPALSGAAGPPWPEPRDLPTLLQRWTWDGKPEQLAVQDGVAYVVQGGGLTALDAHTGRALWQQVYAPDANYPVSALLVLDDTIALALDGRLFLLDRLTGEIRQTVELGGNASHMVGPELVVAVIERYGAVALVSVDRASGRILARKAMGHIVYDLEQRGDVLVAIYEEQEVRDESICAALEPLTLREIWQIRGNMFPNFERFAGTIFLQLVEECESSFQALDPATGALGATLPPRDGTAYSSTDLPWDLELLEMSDDRRSARFRRNDPDTGKSVWVVDLPCVPRQPNHNASDLYLDCHRGAGRNYFVTLDWATGYVRNIAYGLARVRSLHLLGELMIAATDDAVVAFSAVDFGPPERETNRLADDVQRILADEGGDASPYGRGDRVADRVRDLEALGPDALPWIAEQIPAIGTTSLIAAAHVLTAGGHGPAAPALAARLQTPLENPGTSYDSWNPQFAVLEALATLGGEDEVPVVAEILDDPARYGPLRRQALATLVSIGTPAAVGEVHELLGIEPAGASPVWRPPSATHILDLLRTPMDAPTFESTREQARRRHDRAEVRRLEIARSGAWVDAGNGRAVAIFPDVYLGSHDDLWLNEIDAQGAIVGYSLYLGRLEGARTREATLRARMEGASIEISLDGGDGLPLRVDLTEASLDSDGDGIPDSAERRMRLDPRKLDTDGDGWSDAEDPAPNATPAAAASEDHEIRLAIFHQFFRFEEPRNTEGLAIVSGGERLEWRGRRGPTITLDEPQRNEFIEETGWNGAPHVKIEAVETAGGLEPGSEASADKYGTAEGLRPDERLYDLSIWRGGLNALGYRVVVRELDGRWVIAQVQLTWIS